MGDVEKQLERINYWIAESKKVDPAEAVVDNIKGSRHPFDHSSIDKNLNWFDGLSEDAKCNVIEYADSEEESIEEYRKFRIEQDDLLKAVKDELQISSDDEAWEKIYEIESDEINSGPVTFDDLRDLRAEGILYVILLNGEDLIEMYDIPIDEPWDFDMS